MKDFIWAATRKTLENMDSSSVRRTFVVFEIDSIKRWPTAFLWSRWLSWMFSCKNAYQKNRKVLVIEEAWKLSPARWWRSTLNLCTKQRVNSGPVWAWWHRKYKTSSARKSWKRPSSITRTWWCCLTQNKFKGTFRHHQDDSRSLTDVDCKKFSPLTALKTRKDAASSARYLSVGHDQRCLWRGRNRASALWLHDRTSGERGSKLYKRELQCSHQEAIEGILPRLEYETVSAALPFAQKVTEAGCVLNLTTKITSNENEKDFNHPVTGATG